MPRVVIVDDQSTSRMILEEVVRSAETGLAVESYVTPLEALDSIKAQCPDLIVADYKMPEMNGAAFTRRVREIPKCADVPLVMITAVEGRSIRYQALEAGATDFLTKPIDHHECRTRCRNLLKLRRQQQLIKDRTQWLEEQVQKAVLDLDLREKETLNRLARASEIRDRHTGNFVMRMGQYSRLIAGALGMSKQACDVIEHAAPMHDIGKIGISDAILLKRGRLTMPEWTTMRTHPTIGYDILCDSSSKYLQLGAVIALRHHEHYDGNGYPDGLKGEAIPIEARIVAVADVYDALVSERPYKPAWQTQSAFEHLLADRGTHFDPACVDAFIARREDISQIQAQYAD